MTECFRCRKSFDKELKYNVCWKCNLYLRFVEYPVDWVYDRFGYGVDWRRLYIVFSDGPYKTAEDFKSDCRSHYMGGKITIKTAQEFLDKMVSSDLAKKHAEHGYVLTTLGYRLSVTYGPNSTGLEHIIDGVVFGINCCNVDEIVDAVKNGLDTTPEINEYMKYLGIDVAK